MAAVDPTIETTYTSIEALTALLTPEKLSWINTQAISDSLSSSDMRRMLNQDNLNAATLLVKLATRPENAGLRVGLLSWVQSEPYRRSALKDPNAPVPEIVTVVAFNPLAEGQDPILKDTYKGIDVLTDGLVPYRVELMASESITSCLSGTDCLRILFLTDDWDALETLTAIATRPEKWRLRVSLLEFIKSKNPLRVSVLKNPNQPVPELTPIQQSQPDTQIQLSSQLPQLPSVPATRVPHRQASIDVSDDHFQRRLEELRQAA